MKFMYKTAVALMLFAAVLSTPASAGPDFSKIDIRGFRLGMSADDAKKIAPQLKLRPVAPDKKTVIGYRASIGDMTLFFTSGELGTRLFDIRMVKVYADKPNPYPIFEKFVKKYGKPDYEGRKMFHIHACWGKCFGDFKRLEFTIKISGMGSKPYPMSLVLTDPVLEKENRKLFFKNKDGGG